MTTNSKIRSDFEAWWSEFQETHEEWPFADKESLLFAAWENALSQQSAQESNQKYTFGQLTNLMMAAATNEGHKVTMRIKWAEQKNEALKLNLAAMEPKP